MSDDRVYSADGIEICKRDGKFFVRYDAGAHMVALREDEISSTDAATAMSSTEGATDVLLRLQRRLHADGIDPYKANV